MALSSEQRDRHQRYLAKLRGFGQWAGEEALDFVAVADHLAACEALLGEIDSYFVNGNGKLIERDAYIEFADVSEIHTRIAALLGPAATKEGG